MCRNAAVSSRHHSPAATAPARWSSSREDRGVVVVERGEPADGRRHRGDDEHRDVDRDQAEGDRTPPAPRGPQAASAPWPCATEALPLPDALRALEPDRGRDHAVRADRPAAPRAGDAGRPVGVAVAVRRVGGRRLVARSAALHLDGLDDDVLDGRSLRPVGDLRDRVDDVAAGLVGHLAEDRVLAVQVRRRADGDEELRAVGARARRWPSPAGRAGRTPARGGTRRRTGSRGRRCRCPSGSPPWIMKPSMTRWKTVPS